MLPNLRDTTSPKPKLDNRLDRLYYSYIDEEVDAGLSVADREEFVRLLTAVRTNLAAQREQEKAANG